MAGHCGETNSRMRCANRELPSIGETSHREPKIRANVLGLQRYHM